jgi:large subunit ribosomal protein L25
MMALKHGGSNALLRIDVEGKTLLALTKQIQADPIKGFLEHLDFVEVKKGEKVTVEIPIHLMGEAAPDTMVSLERSTISVETEATHIPTGVEVSIEGLPVGSQIHAKDVQLPEGTTLAVDAEALVVNITAAPTAEQLEAELAEAEAEVGIVHEPTEEEKAAEAEAAEGGEGGEGSAEGESPATAGDENSEG